MTESEKTFMRKMISQGMPIKEILKRIEERKNSRVGIPQSVEALFGNLNRRPDVAE